MLLNVYQLLVWDEKEREIWFTAFEDFQGVNVLTMADFKLPECYVTVHDIQFSSVAQSCPTLCDPMDCSMAGLPVHHQLLEFTQTHVHWVGYANHLILCCPLLLSISKIEDLTSIFPSIRVFPSGGQSIGVSALASVLPMNIQDWFSLGWDWLDHLAETSDSQESSPTPQFKSIDYSVLSFLYSPTLTSIQDYWKKP